MVKKRKNLKRFLALALSAALSFTDVISAMADVKNNDSDSYIAGTDMTKEQLEEALAQDKALYPDGRFEFFISQVNGEEGGKRQELIIVRRGGTESEATVNFKAVDVSAAYGDDYLLTVKESDMVSKTLEGNGKPLSDFNSSDMPVLNNEEETYEETGNVEEAESAKVSEGVKATNGTALQNAKDTYLGTDSSNLDWQKLDEAHKAEEEARNKEYNEAYNEFAEDVEGTDYTFTFKKEECIKSVYIDIIDDDKSESDEQVMFLLSNASSGEVAGTTTAYLNIKDNEESERAIFAMDACEMTVDRSEGKAVITINRVSGNDTIASVIVGTGGMEAKAGSDYEAVQKEIIFAQGVTQQTVEIPLLDYPGAPSLAKFQVALDANQSFVQEDCAITTVNLTNNAADASTETVNDSENMSSDAAWEWNDTRTVSCSASVASAKNSWSGRQLILSGIDLSTASKIDVTWKSDEGSTSYERTSGSGCNTSTWTETSNNRNTYLWINDNLGIEKKGAFGETTDTYELSDANKATNSHFKLEVLTQGENQNATARVSKIVIHYPGYQYTVVNKLYTEGAYSNQYKEKIYTDDADATLTDDYGHKFKYGNEIPLGTLQISRNGENKFGDSVTVHRSQDTLQFRTTYTQNKNYNGVQVKQGISGNIYLAGYQLQAADSKSWSKLIAPQDIKLTKEFITQYKDYIFNGNEFKIRPVYRPYNVRVMFQNENENKGSYANGFDTDQVLRCTTLDTIKVTGIAKKGYSIDGFKLGCHKDGYVHQTGINENTLAARANHYYDQSDSVAVSETNRVLNPGYPKSPVSTAKTDVAIGNVVTFTPTAEFTYITPVYSVPKVTVKVDPLSNNKDKGAVVYSDENNVLQGDYKNTLIISGVTLNQDYTLNAVTDDGFKAYFKNFTGDVNEDGRLTTQEKAVVSKYNFVDTASRGNAYTFRPVIDSTLIYYGFDPRVENRYAGCIDGVVAIQDKPIFGDKVTETAVNGAQISVAGMTTTTNTDDKFGGVDGQGGDGYFSLSSREFVAGENQTLNIAYNNVFLSATQAVNAAGFYVLDSYDTIGVNAADVFTVNGNSVKKINVTNVSNGDTTYRFTIQTYSKNDTVRASKAVYKFYRKDGTIIDSATKTVESTNGTFTLDFNPKTLGIMPGATMTVQFFDQNGVGYYEHDMGFSFAESIGVISFLSSFNFGGAEKTLELIGTIDSVFNFGWDGDLDEVDDYVSNSEDGKVKTIRFGYSFDKDKEFPEEEKEESKKKKEAVKDAAKNSGTSKEQKAKQDKAAKDAVDKNAKDNKSKTDIGGSAEIELSFALEINLAKSDDAEHKGQWYFRDMMLCATVDGGVEVTVSYVTPIGIPVRARLKAGGSGAATFIVDQNYDKDEYYISQVMDKTAGKVDIFNFNMNNGDNAFDAYGIFNISPYIDVSAGAGFDFLNLMIGGQAEFDMNFYTRADQKDTGDVTFSAYIEMKILFFEKRWDIAKKTINMFGESSSIEQLSGNPDYTYESLAVMEADTREYLKNRSEWMGESDMKAQSVAGTSGVEEFVLENGVNPNPDIKIQTLTNGRYLAVFLDDNKDEDTYNCTHVYYTIGDGNTWTKPALIENDGTTDDSPSIFDLGEKGIYVAWSSADRKLTADDTVIGTLNSMNIHGAFFDTEKMAFGDVQEITSTSPYSYKDKDGDDVTDNVADVEPHVSYDAETNRMLMYYTKIEYTSTAQDDEGLVGDVAKPYSLIAYRVYDFAAGKWVDTYTEEEAMDENYTKAWYGQRFLDLAPLAVVSEKMDEQGYWTDAPDIKEYTKAAYTGADGKTYEQDPIVIESTSTTYNGLGLFAYVLDYDGNKETESDRDIFLQVYNYSENRFSHPIMVTTTAGAAESKIGFGRCGNTTLLTYLCDDTLYALNISYIVKYRLLSTTVVGQTMYYIDKTAPTGQEKEGDHVYMPPVLVAGATLDDVTDGEAIIDYKVASTDKYVYVFWTRRSTKVKAGIDENSEEALDANNRVAESQIYVARYDTHAEIITSPVKVTDEEGANYGSIGFVVSEGEVGNVKMLATKSGSVVETMEGKDESGKTIKTDIITEDTNNKELVSLDFTPVSTLKVQDISIAELMAGTDTSVSMNLYNDGLQTLTDLTLSVKDAQGKELFTKIIKAEEDYIYGGRLYPVSFPITLAEDAVDYKFTYSVTDNTGKVLAEGSYSEEIPLQIDVKQFEAVTDVRGNINFKAMVVNNSKRKSGIQKVSILRKINEVENDYKEITSFYTEDLMPGQSGYYEVTYDYGKYENMFSTFISKDSESLEATTYFKAVCGENGESAEDYITMEASKEQRLRMSAIQKVTLVDENYNVIESSYNMEGGDIAQINTAVESLSYSGSRYEGNDDAENYDKTNVAGLKVMYTSDNEDVVVIYDNGYVEAVGEGTANITAYVMPYNSKQFYTEETGILVEDNFATLPQEAMILKNVKVTVGNPEPEKTSLSDCTVKLSGTSYNWTGKTVTPKVTVKNKSGITLKSGTDYTVSYSSGRKNVGTYKVTIKGKGNYTGTVTKSFIISVAKNKTYTVGGYSFKITKNYSGSKAGNVTVTKAANKKMTAIKIADSVKIGGKTFNITAIGSSAFSGFTKVKTASIGKNVTSIGSKAFYNCKSLKGITINSTKISSVGSKAIGNISYKAVIKVPSTKVSAYKKKFTRKTGFTNKMSIKKK